MFNFSGRGVQIGATYSVQNHCKNGRIKGLLKVGTNYLIPKDAVKPTYTYIYESNENTKK